MTNDTDTALMSAMPALQQWVSYCQERGVDEKTAHTIFSISPTSFNSRVDMLDKHIKMQQILAVSNIVDAEEPVTPDIFDESQQPATAVVQQMHRHKRAAANKKQQGRPVTPFSARTVTPKQQELFQLSLQIDENDAKTAGELGYIATAMIHASLPHSRVTTLDAQGNKVEGSLYKKKTNYVSLTIMNDPEIGLPFGKIPRLITAFLCTQAKLTGSRFIELGKSQAEFAEKLGLTNAGGARGDITRLKDQTKRLLSSKISLIGEPGTEFHWRHVNVSDQGMLLWDNNPNIKSKWNSQLELNQKFFDECIQHSMPLDLRVIHKLQSSLAIDIYIWLNYRLNSISAPTRISWMQLKYEFGAGYADDEQGLANFISKFKQQLRTVLSVYRGVKVDPDTGKVLTLYPSATHVARLN